MANKSIMISMVLLLLAAVLALGLSSQEEQDAPSGKQVKIIAQYTIDSELPAYEDRADLKREQSSPDTAFDRKSPFYKEELKLAGVIC